MSRARAIEADHLDLQIVTTIDMACLLGTNELEMNYPDELESFIESYTPNSHASVKDMLAMMQERDSEEAHQWLYGNAVFGIVMGVRTPVRKHWSETGWKSSFSHSYIGWVYGNTYDEAWEQAKNWAESRHAIDLEKFLKGRAA
jgi:hypothetical protein